MNSKKNILKKSKTILIFLLLFGINLTIFSFPTTADSYDELTIEPQNLDLQENQLVNETYPVLNKNNTCINYSEKLNSSHQTNNYSADSKIFNRNNTHGSISEDDEYIYVKNEKDDIQLFYKNNLTYKKEIKNRSNNTIKRKGNNNTNIALVNDFSFELTENKLFLKPENLDENIVSYHWDFGDGTYKVGSDVSHEYKKPGVYEVTLTVNYGNGKSTTVSKKVNVENISNDNGFLFIGKPVLIIIAFAFLIIILICKYSFKSNNKPKNSVSKKDRDESIFVWKPSVNNRVFDKNEELFNKKNKRFFYSTAGNTARSDKTRR
jgi:PKD repeat protein